MGGIAQGIGQVLMEDIAYDREPGQLLAGSFMDYAMPRADDLLRFDDRGQPGADADQSARRQGRGRSRHGRLARRVINAIVDALPARHPPHRHAGDAVARVAGDQRGNSHAS